MSKLARLVALERSPAATVWRPWSLWRQEGERWIFDDPHYGDGKTYTDAEAHRIAKERGLRMVVVVVPLAPS